MKDTLTSYSTPIVPIACRERAGTLALRVAAALCALFGALLLATATAFAAPPERPETLKPTEPVKATEATFHGIMNPGKEGPAGTYELGTYEFLYKESSKCEGGSKAPESPGISLGGGMEGVSQTVSGLQPNTQYTVCLLARNGIKGEETVGLAVTFTTALPPETPEKLPANPIAATTATLHGVLNPKNPGNAGTYEFRYEKSATECTGPEVEPPGSGQFPYKATPTETATGAKQAPAQAEVTGLLPSTTYTFCLLARNEAGEEALGAPETFTTSTAPPAIEGESVPHVLSTEATLSAQIDPEGLPVSYHVEYGTSEAYGQSTPEVSIPAAQGATSVEVRLSELQAGTTYDYRFVATNASHETTQDKEDQAFTTLPAAPPPGSEHCTNEALRVGRSANLPDCRAYELVTPADLGRTQDLTFREGSDFAIASSAGESIALETLVPLEPNPSAGANIIGTRAVFSRTPTGWTMKSATAPGTAADRIEMKLFSPDLSQVAFYSFTAQNLQEVSPDVAFDVGPVGGPYALVASVSQQDKTVLAGASEDFSHVLFDSTDHELLSAPTGTDRGAFDLYEWTAEGLQLINVMSGPLANPCGAQLGAGPTAGGFQENSVDTVNAVSEDGSKVFFTSPDPDVKESTEPGCQEPERLYMRVNGSETVEVSEPEAGVHLEPSEILPVRYDYDTPDSSKVFFNTQTALTKGETAEEQSQNKLFEYNTQEPEGKRLKLIASGVPEIKGVGLAGQEGLIFSEDGSTVYVQGTTNGAGLHQIYRYDTRAGTSSFVATARSAKGFVETSFSTANGEFFLFTSNGVEGEPRGESHNELYRYDHANGDVMCVTCGPGVVAPAQGEEVNPEGATLDTIDEMPAVVPISRNGQEVFFQTTARLVSQDTNSTEIESSSHGGENGLDVYEWEADGAGGCEVVQGCTHLLSAGEASGPSVFLGASNNGSNVFFASPAQLAPQATPEFTNIYDARVDGGFAPPSPAPECLSCQGVGSPPPLFNTPASGSFAGAGNPAAPVVKAKAKKKKRKSKHRKKRKGKSKAAVRKGRSDRASKEGKRS